MLNSTLLVLSLLALFYTFIFFIFEITDASWIMVLGCGFYAIAIGLSKARKYQIARYLFISFFIERFNRTYREDILDAYLFENIEELRFLTQQFRLDYNENHPHKSLGGLSPIKYAMNSGKLSKFTTIHSLTG